MVIKAPNFHTMQFMALSFHKRMISFGILSQFFKKCNIKILFYSYSWASVRPFWLSLTGLNKTTILLQQYLQDVISQKYPSIMHNIVIQNCQKLTFSGIYVKRNSISILLYQQQCLKAPSPPPLPPPCSHYTYQRLFNL